MREHAEARDVSRIESFSDGVFAIAGTLLVLDLHVPQIHEPTSRDVARALGENWTNYVAFIASFTQILIIWVNHHGIFRHVKRHDALLSFANGFLLLMVTSFPWPTALVSRYLDTPGASIACAVYASVLLLINIAFNLLWLAVAHRRRLLREHLAEHQVRRIRNRYLSAFPVYVASVVLAFVSPWASLVLSNALWILWIRMGRTHVSLVGPDE